MAISTLEAHGRGVNRLFPPRYALNTPTLGFSQRNLPVTIVILLERTIPAIRPCRVYTSVLGRYPS